MNTKTTEVISPELIKHVSLLQQRGTPASVIKKSISEKTGFKRTKSAEIYKEILSGGVVPVDVSIDPKTEEFWETNIATLEKPYFNAETKQYIVFVGAVGRNIVVPESQHKAILQMYSNWDGEQRSINEICRSIQWPKPVLVEYLKKFGITHSSLPVTEEDLNQQSDDELVSRLRELRKFSVYQRIEKESWNEIRDQAAKWRAFEYKVFDPFISFLKDFNPTPVQPLKSSYNNSNANHSFLIGLSDVHFAAHIHPRYIYNDNGSKDGWSINHTIEAVDKYFTQIKEEVNSRTYKFDKAILCSLGDILHGFNGETEKGTVIDTFPMGQEQFDAAFQTLTLFISRTLEVFNECEVHSVAGNHSLLDTILFKALEAYFRTDNRIKFNIYDTRHASFKVRNTLFIMEHGASPYYKSKLPKGSERKAYIQQLFLAKPELLMGNPRKVFLSADQHHFEANELGDIEQYMFSTLVGADKYADHNNWQNTPRQNCLVINDSGVKDILSFYL